MLCIEEEKQRRQFVFRVNYDSNWLVEAYLEQVFLGPLGIEYGGFVAIQREMPSCDKPIST